MAQAAEDDAWMRAAEYRGRVAVRQDEKPADLRDGDGGGVGVATIDAIIAIS